MGSVVGGGQCLLNSANSKAKKIKPLQARGSFTHSGPLTKIKYYRVSQAVNTRSFMGRGGLDGTFTCLNETTSQFHNTATDTHARGHTGSRMGAGRRHREETGTDPAAGDKAHGGQGGCKGAERPPTVPPQPFHHANHFKALLDRLQRKEPGGGLALAP